MSWIRRAVCSKRFHSSSSNVMAMTPVSSAPITPTSLPPIGYGLIKRFFKQPMNYEEQEILRKFHTNDAIKDLKKFGENYQWYYDHRDSLLNQHSGQWLIIDDKEILAASKDFQGAVISAGNEVNADSAFAVYCGFEKVNTYWIDMVVIDEDDAHSITNLAMDWSHVASPHQKEWTALSDNEPFEDIHRSVSYFSSDGNNVQSQVRPFVTLPVTLKDNKRYPVTFLIDWGSPQFYLSKQLMEALADVYAQKSKSCLNYGIDGICKGDKITLRDPQLHPSMDNVNVMPYAFAEKHDISLEHLQWRKKTDTKITESGMEPLVPGDENHPFFVAKQRFIKVMQQLI